MCGIMVGSFGGGGGASLWQTSGADIENTNKATGGVIAWFINSGVVRAIRALASGITKQVTTGGNGYTYQATETATSDRLQNGANFSQHDQVLNGHQLYSNNGGQFGSISVLSGSFFVQNAGGVLFYVDTSVATGGRLRTNQVQTIGTPKVFTNKYIEVFNITGVSQGFIVLAV